MVEGSGVKISICKNLAYKDKLFSLLWKSATEILTFIWPEHWPLTLAKTVSISAIKQVITISVSLADSKKVYIIETCRRESCYFEHICMHIYFQLINNQIDHINKWKKSSLKWVEALIKCTVLPITKWYCNCNYIGYYGGCLCKDICQGKVAFRYRWIIGGASLTYKMVIQL